MNIIREYNQVVLLCGQLQEGSFGTITITATPENGEPITVTMSAETWSAACDGMFDWIYPDVVRMGHGTD